MMMMMMMMTSYEWRMALTLFVHAAGESLAGAGLGVRR